ATRTAPAVKTLKGYQWPLVRGRLTQSYGFSRIGSTIVAGRPFHDGIDLASYCGDRIVAAHSGVVIAAGRRFDDFMGWQGDLAAYKANLDAKKAWTILPLAVVIDDGNGYWSVYAHFESLAVKRGDIVRGGQFLGREGMTGHASGCHLHYGLFSPWEAKVFGLKASVAARLKLPSTYTARINPLLVMPWRPAPPPKRHAKPARDG
ncbi:MAG: M23 family metallopeptidase, partial [Chloroflexota bacterium]